MASRLETTINGHATESRGLEGMQELQNDCAYKPRKQNHVVHHTRENKGEGGSGAGRRAGRFSTRKRDRIHVVRNPAFD